MLYGTCFGNTRVAALAAAVLLAGVWMPTCGASAYTLKTLYSFCAKHGCKDGAQPSTGLLADQSGNLYGTTLSGGANSPKNGGGTVFELTPGANNTWTYTVLYSFCSLKKCADGESPTSALIMDAAGNLYGTTTAGGPSKDGGNGVAFELVPNADRSKWTLEVLHAFCSKGGKACSDGGLPGALTYAGAASGAPYDGTSALYGTTANRGAFGPGGVAFQLKPGKNGWAEEVLYDFCSVGGDSCTDGSSPVSGLIVDGSGNLFGTADGGTRTFGVAFELSPVRKGNWTETVLYNFCSLTNCTDGAYPNGEMLRDASGNLFGTTEGGGGGNCSFGLSNCGIVFKLVPNGASSQETVLHSFCSSDFCADGFFPLAGLTMDSSGNLFGTTYVGGANKHGNGTFDGGTVFKLNGTEQVLYNFCTQKDCADGHYASGRVIMDGSGNLFGTTSQGGSAGAGTLFELTP